MSRLRYVFPLLAPLLLAALVACGAAPQSAAPSAPSAVAAITTVALLVTVAPAPTAAPAAQETSMPNDKPGPTPSLTPLDRTALTRPVPAAERVPTPAPAAAVTGEVPQTLLDTLLDDAAQRSGVERSQITVQLSQAVEWSDGALGCAKPGMNYLQVITPGYQVLLQAGTASYDYHADERGRFVLCEPGR